MPWRVVGAFLTTLALAGTLIAQGASHPEPSPASTTQASQPSGAQDTDTAVKDESNSGRKTHFKLGTISVGGGYSYTSGYPWYPYGPYGYRPYYAYGFWDPFWGPFSPYSYPVDLGYGSGKGELQLKADPKDAEVYIDGAYAGTVQRLKNIWLEPGAYDLSFSAAGREPFQRRVYVLTGKTLSISAKLLPKQASAASNHEEKQ